MRGDATMQPTAFPEPVLGAAFKGYPLTAPPFRP